MGKRKPFRWAKPRACIIAKRYNFHPKQQVMASIEHWSHRGAEQPSREFTCAAAKARTNDAALSIPGKPATLHLNFLRSSLFAIISSPRSSRFAPGIRDHRLLAMAEWIAATKASRVPVSIPSLCPCEFPRNSRKRIIATRSSGEFHILSTNGDTTRAVTAILHRCLYRS